jgi:hypothetical protein
MSGTGTNRRAGLHYFCSDPTLTNRGNSYFVFFRLDNDKIQIYEVANDVYSLVDEVVYDFNADQWYDYKIAYDRITGKHQVYVNNVLARTWTDPTPLTTGDYISFRTGNCVYKVNDLRVYRSRNSSTSIAVGTNGDMRYESPNSLTSAGRIRSIVQDVAGNLSAISAQDVKIDWTNPTAIQTANDGESADASTTTSNSALETDRPASSEMVKLKVYPNPVSDVLVVETNRTGGMIIITDYMGRIVLEKKLDMESTQLKTDHLSGGIYQLLYSLDGKTSRQSIMKR